MIFSISLFGDGKSIFPNITTTPATVAKTNDILIKDPKKLLRLAILVFFENSI